MFMIPAGNSGGPGGPVTAGRSNSLQLAIALLSQQVLMVGAVVDGLQDRFQRDAVILSHLLRRARLQPDRLTVEDLGPDALPFEEKLTIVGTGPWLQVAIRFAFGHDNSPHCEVARFRSSQR